MIKRLSFLVVTAMLCTGSAQANNGNGKENGGGKNKSSKVVGKDSRNKNSRFYSREEKKEEKDALEKSKEIAEVISSDTPDNSSGLSAMDKLIFSKYMDLEGDDFEKPILDSYKHAFKGYHKLKKEGKIKKDILTIIDFTLHSSHKRMWVIDMKENKVLYNTVVSHGKNSGKEYATRFSNTPESHQSSLGFFATAETYIGKHGLSLRLDGLETGINDNARMRHIVIHGADYANETLIDAQGWLGRSFGCPALPMDNYREIINLIKDESCLLIFHNDNQDYKKKSEYFF